MIPVEGVSHLGIVVPDLAAARRLLQQRFGLTVGAAIEAPDQGVRLAYATLGGFKIELLEPATADSPIAKFLERNPRGGLHHVAFSVADAEAAADTARADGLKVLGEGPKPGNHGRPLFFLHPADLLGALIEIEQAPDATASDANTPDADPPPTDGRQT